MARSVKALPGPARTQGYIEIAEGVHIFIGGDGGTNFGLVLTDEKPVIVDNDIRIQRPLGSGMRRKSPGKIARAWCSSTSHHNFDHHVLRQRLYHKARGCFRRPGNRVVIEMEREGDEGIWVKQMAGRPQKVEHLNSANFTSPRPW